MTDPIQEQLSAFHDGELAAAEAELLLKRLQRDAQLRGTVGRYALIGEALRATEAGGPSRNFVELISQAIEQEAIPKRIWRPVAGWLKPIAGGAIAAGVAAIALVSLRIAPLDNPATSATLVTVEANVPAPVAETAVARVAENADPAPRYTVPMNNKSRNAPPIQIINDARLANFVMAHSEYSSPLGQRNVLTGLLVEDPTVEQGDAQPASAEPPKR
jgi:negative regulator of sigma E activity